MKKAHSLLLTIFVVIIGVLGISLWLTYEDSQMTQARKANQFGDGNYYIITKTDSSGALEEQNQPSVYAVYKVGESRSSSGLSWRRIGESKVDLEQYLGKQVSIDGEYYEGIPLLINQPVRDDYGVTAVQPVIRINRIY